MLRCGKGVPAALIVASAAVSTRLSWGTEVEGGLQDVPFLYVLAALNILMVLAVVHLLRQIPARTQFPESHDQLTGLPDTWLFRDRVELALSQARERGHGSAMLFLDLDGFKHVNDSLGHEMGDALLEAVARRLRSCLRDLDGLTRVGADEFAILVSSVEGPQDAEAAAQAVLQAFKTSFSVARTTIGTSASIGIALYPEHGVDAAALMRLAETAMHRAKARGRNTVQLFSDDIGVRARRKLSLESNLHAAIDRDELVLHFQPQVDLHSGQVVGVEALARWRHPGLGFLPPRAFIPLAEESGFILPLGEWVLETACRQAEQWRQDGLLDAKLSVNVSAVQFARQRLDEVVAGVLQRTHLPGRMLELELTESVLIQDTPSIRATLQALRSLGVGCAFDDFGTGFSALNYLTRMPVDRLKIDRSFIQNVAEHRRDQVVVQAIIALAQGLQVHVIAEGVETEEQARFLRDFGCLEVQGYLFGRPMPVNALEDWLRTRAGFHDAERSPSSALLDPMASPMRRRSATGPGARLVLPAAAARM